MKDDPSKGGPIMTARSPFLAAVLVVCLFAFGACVFNLAGTPGAPGSDTARAIFGAAFLVVAALFVLRHPGPALLALISLMLLSRSVTGVWLP